MTANAIPQAGSSPERCTATRFPADSLQARVDRLTYDMDEGEVLSRQPAFDLRGYTGMPDGMSIDEWGCLWIAFPRAGAVRRFGPGGQLLAELRIPVSRTTSGCFGGEDLRDLFITTARRSIRDDRLSDTEPLAGAAFRCRAASRPPMPRPATGARQVTPVPSVTPSRS
jgi:sugar lactone lactonase YvrE